MMKFDRFVKPQIEFAQVDRLLPIEEYDMKRVWLLAKKIEEEGVWTVPLFIEKTHRLVLDGTHRLQAAKFLGLSRLPVQYFDYHEVKPFSLRKEEKVTIPFVIEKAKRKRLYPYKTVKHKFPCIETKCKYRLEELK